MEQVAAYLVGEDVSIADYHQEWADELKESHPGLTDKDQALNIVQESVEKSLLEFWKMQEFTSKQKKDKLPLCVL